MSKIAKTAGITREALYKSLSKEGDPKLSTLLGVTDAIGFKLIVSPEKKRRRAA
jgi:probable addiction module antidote protein